MKFGSSKSIPIHRLYEAIPTTTCPSDCGKCCGPVPVTNEEAKNLGLDDNALLTPIDSEGTCAFYSATEGCTQYEKRPLLCRIYGASHEKGLSCQIGCKASNGRLSIKQTHNIMRSYYMHFHNHPKSKR